MAANRGIFITGTDTGVGKTIAAAALARALRRRGIAFSYLKPVETGIENPEYLARHSDAARVRQAGALPEPANELVLFSFPEPLAPLLAARRQGIELSAERLKEAVASRLSPKRLTLVEGAGGLLAPLAPGCLVLDLIRALALPVIVVSHTGLGAVSHTLLTLDRLRAAKIPLLGLIANHREPDPGVAAREFIAQVTEFSPVPVLGEFPGLEQPPNGRHDWDKLADRLNLDILLQRVQSFPERVQDDSRTQ